MHRVDLFPVTLLCEVSNRQIFAAALLVLTACDRSADADDEPATPQVTTDGDPAHPDCAASQSSCL